MAPKALLMFILLCFLSQFVLSLNFAEPNELDDLPTCTVKVRTETTVEGKCVRLRGGRGACQTDIYLDPLNDDCAGMN